MEKIIDLHTHLDTLPSFASLRNKIQGHVYTIKEHIKKDTQCILGVAIYVQAYQNYDDMVLMINNLKKEINSFGDEIRLITKKADLHGDYKVGITMHIESARILTDFENQLPHLYKLGVRGIIPIHFKDNFIGASCDDLFRRAKIKKADHGLSQKGKNFIKLMNELHMWVDLSHTMDTTADEMLELANEVMVSHGAIRDIVNQKRNKDIDFLKKVAAKGGIFGLIPWQHLIGEDKNSYHHVVETAIEYGLHHSACIGTDLGAPIKTHQDIKSLFDLGEIISEFKEYEQNIKWENAFHFFERALPE